MMERTKDGIEFECDICGEVLETETKVFTEALDKLKVEGWRAERVHLMGDSAPTWNHYCADC